MLTVKPVIEAPEKSITFLVKHVPGETSIAVLWKRSMPPFRLSFDEFEFSKRVSNTLRHGKMLLEIASVLGGSPDSGPNLNEH